MFSGGLLAQGGQQNTTPEEVAKADDSRVKRWISEHPEVKLVSLDHFLSVSPAEQLELTNASPRLIHENDSPSWTEIQTFEASGFQDGNISAENMYLECQSVEQWVAQHPDIKLIEMSVFQSLPSSERAYYLSLDNVIIYDGHLRQEDIDAYQSN